MQRKNSKITQKKSKIESLLSFFYTPYYPLIIGLFVLLSWIFHLQTAMLIILAVIFVCLVILVDDLTPTLPLTLLAIFCINDPYSISNLLIIGLAIPVGISLIYHAIVYKPNKKLGLLFIPLILISCCLLMGGVASPFGAYYILGLPSALTLGVLLLFVYIYFLNYIKPKNDTKIKTYLCWIFIAIALVCCLQYLYGLIILGVDRNQLMLFGWGSSNTLTSMLLITYPTTFYLVCKRKNLLYFLFSAFILATMLATVSDGPRLIILLATPILLIYTAIQLGGIKKKITFGILAGYLLAIVSTIVYFVATDPSRIIDTFATAISTGNRGTLFIQAIDLYVNYPFFGVGLGYPFSQAVHGDNFHSVIFHVMATMGTFGIICYLFYYIFRIKILLDNKKPFNIFAFISFISLELYAVIDTCEFNFMPIVFTLTMMILVCEITNIPKEKKLLKHHKKKHRRKRHSEKI